ncbi:hypothetical protein LHV56_19130 [Peribacillus frigoritolerans]|uniref:hypothetical protein n=1 Tax=Peribacillus frigoritolerans TaxID=450367 RepID=UPI002079DF61|nr:hypothetical protein [Peribacillus frigoritolerans]USK78947.1 hypothetical protein LHV56_19130 [Peribacillus frigoritolerans]
MAKVEFKVELTYNQELTDREKQKVASNIYSVLAKASKDEDFFPLLPTPKDHTVEKIEVDFK